MARLLAYLLEFTEGIGFSRGVSNPGKSGFEQARPASVRLATLFLLLLPTRS
jgi:hypothetical protein